MKLQSTLSLILLVALSVQAAPTEEEELTTAGQLSFTPSNCSLDDLLKELGQDLKNGTEAVRFKRAVCPWPVGPYGGRGGRDIFTEIYCNADVSRIFIRAGGVVDGIMFTYQYPGGKSFNGGYHGGYGGYAHTITINVSKGERVIGVFGRSGGLVDLLGFVTNWGRIFGPYGTCGGRPFTVNSCKVKGIQGRAGGYLDSIV